MRVAVIGTGYVGLVSGTCFAESGNNVLCIDNNPEKIAALHRNEIPIYEPGLDVLFERNVKEGRLRFSESLAEAVEYAEIIFLALPTPPQEDGSADLQYVLSVAEGIGKLLKGYRVIVNKSTVPVGTADLVRDTIAKHTMVPFDVVSNPEFLREGAAVDDFMKPERVVVGTSSERARKVMDELYKPFVMSGNPIYFMDERSAEMTKYAANSFLATKITFMNEIANLCERVGANVDMVRVGIGSDSRIGKRFIFPGVGYGGSCFPKDVSALFKIARRYNYHFRLLDAVIAANHDQKHVLVEKVTAHFGHDLHGKTFCVWGLAFKPNTDDIREAPALHIIQVLTQLGAKVKAFDPEAMDQVRKYTNLDVELCNTMYEALEGTDALLLITEWAEFRNPDFDRVSALLRNKVLFDGRNVFDIEKMQRLGYHYYSIGRKTIHPQS